MYESYWGFNEKPFENTPDPKFIYFSSQHQEGFSRLLYAIKEGKGAAMLTGVFGCGKTLIAKTLLHELSPDIFRCCFLSNPKMEYLEIVMSIAHCLGAKDLPTKKSEVLANVVLESLSEILSNNSRDGKKTVVVIDEAHVIEDKNVWEGLRLLLNFQTEKGFLLTMLFLGQPELRDILERNKQLLQRIAMRAHLAAFNEKETSEYILHRLKVSGASREIFKLDALSRIFAHSAGIPRRINHICDLALLTAASRKEQSIDAGIIKEVVNDMESV